MSWLDDRIITHLYRKEDGTLGRLPQPASWKAPQVINWPDGQRAVYEGFEPEEVRQTNVVEFDKNGRKAVRIRGKDGKVQYLSKSKLKYLKTGKIENHYTKDYEEHLQKTQQKHMLGGTNAKGKGSISDAPSDVLKEKLGSLPDGEYLSDGVSIFNKKGV